MRSPERRPWLKSYHERTRAKAAEAEFNEAFHEAIGRPLIETVRNWPDKVLHQELTNGSLKPAEQSMAEEELRFRSAMRGPAGKALTTSRIALGVSVCAFLLSLWVALAK